MQYSEDKTSVAIISDDIMLILPATSSQALRFLQLPLLDGMVCQPTDDLGNEVTIRYPRTIGYQIFHGVKRAAEDIHLVLRDHSQSTAFAESVQNRVAKRLEDTSAAFKRRTAFQRTSYALVDLSQSRETSMDSNEEISNPAHTPESNLAATPPSQFETHVAAESLQNRQERAPRGSPPLPQALTNSEADSSGNRAASNAPVGLRAAGKEKLAKRSTTKEAAMSSTQAVGSAPEPRNDSQRRLKRPSTKYAWDAAGNDIDWDEGLRNDGIGPGASAAKKPKTTSTKAKKAKKAATGKTSQLWPEGEDEQKKTTKAKAKAPSAKTAAITRTRRAATLKSSKFIEESESDLEDEGDDQPISVVQDSDPLILKQTLSKKDEVGVDDSQSQDNGGGLNSRELDNIENLSTRVSDPVSLPEAQKQKSTVQDEAANDYYPMDIKARTDALAQNDTSFGTKIAQTLTAKTNLPIATIDQPSRKSFGDAKKFVETVNVTRNSSPQKSPPKQPRIVKPLCQEAAIHQSPSVDQRPANSTTYHSPAQVRFAKPLKHRPETHIAHSGPAGGCPQSDDISVAYDEAAPTSISSEDLREKASPSLQGDDMEAAPRGILKKDLDLAAVAVTQAVYQKTVVNTIETAEDGDKENPVKRSGFRDESPKIELSKPATAVSRWSPNKRQSRKLLYEISEGARAQKSMDPPPLPRRSKRRSVRSPINMTTDEFDSSLLMTDEHIQRKTPMVSFGVQDPRNQGVASPSKQSKVADASVPVPPETEKHAAAKRQKKLVLSDPVTLPALAAHSDIVRGRSSEVIEDGGEILIQEGNAVDSIAVGQSSNANDEDEGVLLQQESAVELAPRADNFSRINAWQSSRVDENGSPRLPQDQPRKSPASGPKLPKASATSDHSENDAFASEELEHSVYTENGSSSPAIVCPEQPSARFAEAPKTRMIHTRASIGLQDVVSKTFPQASTSMNTSVFKKQAESTLSKPPVVVEKTVTVVQKTRNLSQPKTCVHPQAVQIESDRAPPLPSPQQLVSDLTARVIRLGPRTSAGSWEPVEEASPTPASFKTGFRNLLMPPPPLPPLRYEKPARMAPPARQGKRKSGLLAEDEDPTLINDKESVEHGRPIRPTTRCRSQQSPDPSTDSVSPPTPEDVPAKNDSREEEHHQASSPAIRITQQHILNVLNRAATVSSLTSFLGSGV